MKGKGIKIFAWVAGAVVLLVVVALAVGLNSSFQTWAVRKAVAGQPGMTLEVAKVSAGFSGAEITDLRLTQDGMVVTAKKVTAAFSAWEYLSSKRINVESLSVDQFEVDLRNAKTAAPASSGSTTSTKAAEPRSTSTTPSRPVAAQAKPRFEGLLKTTQLPLDLRVGSLIAKGRVLLSPAQTLVVDLKAAGIEKGQTGKLDWTVDFADSTAGAELGGARATGTAAVKIAPNLTLDAITLDATAIPSGPRLKGDQVKLTAKAEKSAAGGDENYAADVSLVRSGAAEPLFKTSAQFSAAAHEIAGTWNLVIRSEQVAGLLSGLGLPDLTANGAGKFSLKPDTNAVAASGDLQAQIAKLQEINPALAAIGSATLKTSFDGGLADNVGRLDKLNLEIAGADGRKFAQISSLQKISYAFADKRVTLADPKAELARISLQALPLAWAQPFLKPMVVESGELSLVLAVEAEPDGSRIRTRAIEPLALRTVTLRSGDKKLVDRVTLTLRPNLDYSATRLIAKITDLNASMPDGDTLNANLTADVTNLSTSPAVAFTAELQAKVVSAVKTYVPVPTGPLTVTKTVEGRYEGQTLQFTKVHASASREGNVLLTTIDLLQPLRADLKAVTFTVATPASPAVRVKLGEVPLAWVEPFVAKSKLTGSLAGTTLEVAFRTLDDLTLATVEPIVLRGATAVIDGKTLAQSLDLSADLTATKRGETFSYDVRQIELKQGQTPLATLKASGEAKLGSKFALTTKGNLDTDAAALMAQPMLASFATLSRGRINAAFDAHIGEGTQAKATISAKNLVAKADNRVLGDVELTLDANLKPDGSGSVVLPLTLTNGTRKSDISINGAFGKAADQKTFLFTGKIASNQLLVDDFQPLAALAPQSEPAKPASPTPQTRPATGGRGAAPPTTPAPRDTVPFWNAVNGKFEVDLKRVVYGKDYEGAVRGTASITPSRLALDGLEGKFKDNPFKLAGGITFAAAQPKPYTLAGMIDVSGVDLGPLLQGDNPKEKPQVESTVRVAGKFNGNGTNLSTLAESTSGQFDVTGGKGTLRIIKGKAGAGAGLVSLAGSIFGAATGHTSVTAASTIVAELVEMQFDQFSVHLERGADLNLKLTSIEFISPTTRLTGTGSVTHQANVPIVDQPMQIEMHLAGKGAMLRMLDEARVLGEKPDEKGYGPMRAPFRLQGSLSKIQDNLLLELGSAALNLGSDLRNSRPQASPTPTTPNSAQPRRQQFR